MVYGFTVAGWLLTNIRALNPFSEFTNLICEFCGSVLIVSGYVIGLNMFHKKIENEEKLFGLN